MRFLTRRHWIAFWGFMTATIVIAVSTTCTAATTQPTIVSQSTSPELAQSSVASNAVTIQGFQFKPSDLTVTRGSTVTFTNQDATPHTVTPEEGANFTGTGRLQENDSKQVAFNQVGEQNYFCEIHPSMKGQITVIN
jgi:plastocyanin